MSEKLQTMKLTEGEAKIILERRAKETHQLATDKFQIKALGVANRWMKWSNKTGSGLTFSTFQSSYEFNYLDNDRSLMYEAVKTIMATIHSLQIPEE